MSPKNKVIASDQKNTIAGLLQEKEQAFLVVKDFKTGLRWTRQASKALIKENENLGIAKLKATKQYSEVHSKVLDL